jgi:hypothetical protein
MADADACICIPQDYDPADVCHRVDVKAARKPHKCCECRRTIPKGAPYCRETVLFEGEWSRYATCQLCLAIREDRFKCGFHYEGMWEEIRLWADEITPCPDDGEEEDDLSWADPPTHPIEVL